MASGIYKIRNVVNGHIYVGSAVNIKRRWSEHIGALKKRNHKNRYLQNAWDKYGVESFEFSIIEECEAQNLIEREQYYLDTLMPQYNVCKVAGSPLGVKRSAETRAKMSARQIGRKLSAETRAKCSAWQVGRKLSTESREKMSLAKKGRTISAEHRAKLSVALKGIKRSDETRAKMSVSKKEQHSKKRMATE